jgi:hypothetical protein
MAEFPISGQIDSKAFPFLLMDLHRQTATGSLKVEGPSYQKALYYRGGRILFGSSNDPRDQLGAILIEAGKITPEQLEDVNAKVGPGNPLAKALADSGFVSQRELGEAARAKVERIVSDLLVYESGSFEFEDGVLPKGAVDLKLSTEKLFVNGVRRIADRGFVLRHLGGLDVVLAPTPAMATQLAEVRAECGGLAEQFDGRRTLKEAAAQTRLDEFEAAKVGCALLLLGLVQAGPAPAAPTVVEPEPEAFDLASTARMAFEELPTTLSMPPPAEGTAAEPPAIDPAFFMAPPAGAAPAERTEPVIEPAARAAPRTATGPTGFSIVAPPSAASRPPAAIAPPPTTPPAPPSRPAATADRTPGSLPIIPPPQRPATPQRRAPEITVPPSRPASRPSKEDLEALDELLQSKPAEGPLTPLEKAPAPSRSYEPHFEAAAPRRGRAAGGVVTPVLLGALAALVIGGGAAVWYLLLRPAPPTRRAQATPPTPPSTTLPTTPASPVVTPEATPTPEVTPPSASPAAQAPTSTPPPTSPPVPQTPRPAGPTSLGEARALMQRGALAEAARAFAASVRSGQGAYSVQILVACSDDTVRKALDNVEAQELYILPVLYKGRDCYRLLWGLYDTEPRASSATRAVPEYFRRGGARPKVVTTQSVLP